MSLLKVEAKIGAVNELGCRLDDSLEAATKDLYRAEGASAALKQIVVSIENILKSVDKDLEGSDFDLQQVSAIKKYVDKVRQVAVTQSNNAESNRAAQTGKVQGFQQAVQVAKKFKDEEMSKIQLLQSAISQGTIVKTEQGLVQAAEGPRPPGVRPGMSIKERRLAEAAAAPSKETEKSEENPKVEPKQEVKEEAPKPKNKRQKK